jgi:hypothetical protein
MIISVRRPRIWGLNDGIVVIGFTIDRGTLQRRDGQGINRCDEMVGQVHCSPSSSRGLTTGRSEKA